MQSSLSIQTPCWDHHGRQRPLGDAPRPSAHRRPSAGVEAVRRIFEAAPNHGIGTLTLYASPPTTGGVRGRSCRSDGASAALSPHRDRQAREGRRPSYGARPPRPAAAMALLRDRSRRAATATATRSTSASRSITRRASDPDGDGRRAIARSSTREALLRS